MRLVFNGDLVLSPMLHESMVLQNPSTVALRSNASITRSTTTPTSTSRTATSNQRPIIDLLVAMVAVPVLILCALQLEKNLHDMATSPESRWLVFALGVGVLIISVIICGYVTHRMGVCIWAGPIDEAGNRVHGRNMSHINSQNDILSIVDTLPPSYDSVVKFDIPPPPYECLVIDIEQLKQDDERRTSIARSPTTTTTATAPTVSSIATTTTATISDDDKELPAGMLTTLHI